MRILLLGLLAACAAPPEKKPEPVKPPPPKSGPDVRAGLPAGFSVQGDPAVVEAFLEPEDAWRDLRSRLTTLQGEAVARNKDLLVTFEPEAVHATQENGARRTWKLPPGLTLRDCPKHLLFKADATIRLYGADHSQVPLGAEVTVVRASVTGSAGVVREFRLVVKGGRSLRSISLSG